MNPNISPSAQHNVQAQKILARRGKKIEDSPYKGMEKKELRELCDERTIEHKRKDTVATLIELLEA